MKTKILIIKLGFSETLDPEIGKVPSLGDVLRTTPILWAVKEKYPDSHITWLVTENAEALLQGNHLIDRILVWDEFVPFQLMREKFDILINLEKIAGVCALADMIDAWTKHGFRFESLAGVYDGYERGIDFIAYINDKQKQKEFWQQVLIEMLGVVWQEQPYLIGYSSKTPEQFDIGFNYEVGSKWPTKGMDMAIWKELEAVFHQRGLSISWQEGKNNLYDYMDWINSCKTIISNDSLGMHIAIALRKKCIGLFGPTDPNETFFYQGSAYIVSDMQCPQMPCYGAKCATGLICMQHMDTNKILSVYERLNQEHPS